jgi:hypothetical protein
VYFVEHVPKNGTTQKNGAIHFFDFCVLNNS